MIEKLLRRLQKLRTQDLATLALKLNEWSKQPALPSPNEKGMKSEEQSGENIETIELPRRIKKIFLALIRHKDIQNELHTYAVDIKNGLAITHHYPLISANFQILFSILKKYELAANVKNILENLTQVEKFITNQLNNQFQTTMASLQDKHDYWKLLDKQKELQSQLECSIHLRMYMLNELEKTIYELEKIHYSGANPVKGKEEVLIRTVNVLRKHDIAIGQIQCHLENIRAVTNITEELIEDQLSQIANQYSKVKNSILQFLQDETPEKQLHDIFNNKTTDFPVKVMQETSRGSSPRIDDSNNLTKPGLLRSLSSRFRFLSGIERAITPPPSPSAQGGHVSPKMPRYNISLYHTRSSSIGSLLLPNSNEDRPNTPSPLD